MYGVQHQISFQIADTIGSMINDINLMLNADSNTTELTYLKKLK